MNRELSPIFSKGRQKGIWWTIIGFIVLLLGSGFSLDNFSRSYLYGYIFWLLFSIGGLAALMLHHMVAGAWGFLIQRIVESAAKTIYVMFVLFLPIMIFLMPRLYPWHPDHSFDSHTAHAAQQEEHHEEDGGNHHEDDEHGDEEDHGEAGHDDHGDDHGAHAAHGGHGEHDHHLVLMEEFAAKKAWYLDAGKFRTRAVIYFAIWGALVWYLTSASRRLDKGGPDLLVRRMRRVSSVGMCVLFMTMLFATTDFTMSLDPTFFSTMYAPTFIVGAGLSILALSIIVVTKLKNYKPLSDVYNIEISHHLGNLLLGFTVLWAYTNFSQYLIIYSGNLAEEAPYYLRRNGGGLLEISVFLMIFHFAVPFVILLWRRAKRPIGTLKTVAIWIILMRMVDLYWVIMPNFPQLHNNVGFGSIVACIGAVLFIGGIWRVFFNYFMESRPLLTENDPRRDVAFAKWEGLHHHG